MPPHPPEETSVLSHRPGQDDESSRLTVHSKDPLAFSSANQLSVGGLKGGLHFSGLYASVDHNNDNNDLSPEVYRTGMAVGRGGGIDVGGQQPQPSQQPNGIKNNSGGMVAVLSYRLGDGSALLPPSPSMTPIGLMEGPPKPLRELNGAAAYPGNGVGGGQQGRGYYFDQQPHHIHHHQQQQQQYYHPYQQHQQLHQPQPRGPPSTYLNEFGSQQQQQQQQPNGHQPYIPYSGNSSPAFPNSPTIENFHSAYSSPVIHHRNYESLQSSPHDLAAHYRSSQEQLAFYDGKSAVVASIAPPPYTPTTPQSYGLKSSYVSLWKKATWIVFTMGIFLIPYGVLKACFHLQVSAGAWQTSITYGMLMTADFFAVICFSALNRRRVNQRVKKRDPYWVGLSTGILAVGYREDPILLEGCLKSLRAIRYQRNQRVMLVVDGNEEQDEYMAQIFMKIFEKQGAAVFRPNFLCMDREASDKSREDLVRQLAYHPGPVCVMQPHRGKRSAMYTGFAALLQQGIESVVVTDSDTYLDPAVCKELAFALAESPIVGAATGEVRIYNTGTWVSFLSSLRYWFAFNLERGAQSYHSVVNCVSGPLGIYRMSIVADVMDSWVKQSFLGVLCTYGDDRHLTNLVLREGYKVKFSHHAICYTDTPIRFIAWVTQQTRWSKSFFREIPIQLGCMHLHSPWMTYALLYQLIYPMMMIYNLVNCIYFGTGSQIAWWMFSIMLVGLMKTVYAVRVTRDKKFFFTTIYGFLYMLGYVPAKVYAALTLYDNSWGTRNFTQLQAYIAPVTWGTILFFGVFNNPTRYSERAPIPEGLSPSLLTDEKVIRILFTFGDFSYEELFECMSGYVEVEGGGGVVGGGKRKVARFEV
ncbi:ATP-dependent RNA helicase [Linnemannia hyalina]|uniref:ATP-dependent RNA helicase n=1 Tax=Linnemannia hyalina TaxID=64524 RepID=A0A9P8BXH6_9FUNG|nr:ATP-dependent RNA helicase [Linnemannia hyalina]